MARFNVGVPIESKDPIITVEIDRLNPLSVGRHRIQLVVVDDADPPNQSVPAEFIIQVIDREQPNALIDGPSRVDFGQEFELSGRQSFDIGGTIVLYRWTLMD